MNRLAVGRPEEASIGELLVDTITVWLHAYWSYMLQHGVTVIIAMSFDLRFLKINLLYVANANKGGKQ